MAFITLDAVECDKLFRELIETKFPQCNINGFKVTAKRSKDSDTPSNSFEIKVDFDFHGDSQSIAPVEIPAPLFTPEVATETVTEVQLDTVEDKPHPIFGNPFPQG